MTCYHDTGVQIEIDRRFRRQAQYRSLVRYPQNWQIVDRERELGSMVG